MFECVRSYDLNVYDEKTLLKNVMIKTKASSSRADRDVVVVGEDDGGSLKINEDALLGAQKLLRCFRLRRELEDRDLKGKKTCTVLIQKSKAQREIYKALSQQKANKNFQNQCDLHPFLYEKGASVPDLEKEGQEDEFVQAAIERSNKVSFILEALKILLSEGGHKVLIFSKSIPVIFILAMVIRKQGYIVNFIIGDTKMAERTKIQNQLNDPANPLQVLILCTDAMAEGVQLHGADTVIFHDHHSNPQMDNQAEGRAYRKRQTKPVLVLRLVLQDSAEENTLRGWLQQKRTMHLRLEYDLKDAEIAVAMNQEATMKRLTIRGTGDGELKKLLQMRERYTELPERKVYDDVEVTWLASSSS